MNQHKAQENQIPLQDTKKYILADLFFQLSLVGILNDTKAIKLFPYIIYRHIFSILICKIFIFTHFGCTRYILLVFLENDIH